MNSITAARPSGRKSVRRFDDRVLVVEYGRSPRIGVRAFYQVSARTVAKPKRPLPALIGRRDSS
jgi:hypothetical protein